MGSVLCPSCGRQVAAAAGASQAQCFGCGTRISMQTPSAKPASNPAVPVWIWGVAVGSVCIVILGTLLAFLLLLPTKGAPDLVTNQNEPTLDSTPRNPATNESSTATSNNAAAEPQPEPIVVTDEQRQRAERVAPEVRQQVIEMYDQMMASTNRKVIAPKQSTPRTSIERLLNSIEKREITHMAALFQVDEADIEAVIQVELASRQQPPSL